MSKKKKEIKTNAMRHLDQAKIPYIPHEVELDDAVDGMTVADKLHENPEQVFKTLVTRANTKDYYVFMVPVDQHLSLKKAAKAAGVKNVEMIAQKELFPLTGYVHGGCSPLGMKKSFPVFIHESAPGKEKIFFSGGKIGVQIELDPKYLKELDIKPADLCEEQ